MRCEPHASIRGSIVCSVHVVHPRYLFLDYMCVPFLFVWLFKVVEVTEITWFDLAIDPTFFPSIKYHTVSPKAYVQFQRGLLFPLGHFSTDVTICAVVFNSDGADSQQAKSYCGTVWHANVHFFVPEALSSLGDPKHLSLGDPKHLPPQKKLC